MYKFITPFNYLYYSRLKRVYELLSLIWIYPLFLLVFIFGFYGSDPIPNIFSFLIGFGAWMSIYEIGYLENDALTIRKEANPNIRIPQKDIQFIQDHFKKIYWIRFLIFFILMASLYFSGWINQSQFIIFSVCVICARFFFYLHNTIRSRFNIVTYFFLCLIKYSVFPMVYLGLDFGLEPYWVILFAFPLLRTFEHAVKPKYELKDLQQFVGKLDTFRVKYYTLVTVLTILYFYFFDGSIVFVYALTYFLLFRLGIYLLIGSGRYLRESSS